MVTTVGIPIIHQNIMIIGKVSEITSENHVWPNLGTQIEINKFLHIFLNFRQKSQLYNHPLFERYFDDDFYAFTRGKFLIALTKRNDNVNKWITYHSFQNGEEICNIFHSNDCIIVTNGGIKVVLEKGEVKIYGPKLYLEEIGFMNSK